MCLFFGSWSCEIQFFCVLFTEFCCLHAVFLYNPHELVTVHLIKASCCLGGILMSLTTCIFFFFCSWTNMWKNKKLLQLSVFRRCKWFLLFNLHLMHMQRSCHMGVIIIITIFWLVDTLHVNSQITTGDFSNSADRTQKKS